MDNILKKYFESTKGEINKENYIFDIIESKILIDTEEYVSLYDWQFNMLEEIINIACLNQNKVIYNDISLKNNILIGHFWYNILALDNHEIYLINLSTNNYRKIIYSFQEKQLSGWE